MDKNEQHSVLLPAVSTTPMAFEGDFFWEAHWKKIVAALVAVVIAILAAGMWAYLRASKSAAAASLYASAASVDQWRVVADQYPGSVAAGNAQLRIAAAMRDEGKADEAVSVLDQFTSAQPDHPLAGAAWLMVGEIRQSKGDSVAALAAYREASGRYRDSYAAPLALLAEARLLAAEGKSGESRAVLESVGPSYPGGPAAMMAAAELAAASGQPPTDTQAAP